MHILTLFSQLAVFAILPRNNRLSTSDAPMFPTSPISSTAEDTRPDIDLKRECTVSKSSAAKISLLNILHSAKPTYDLISYILDIIVLTKLTRCKMMIPSKTKQSQIRLTSCAK